MNIPTPYPAAAYYMGQLVRMGASEAGIRLGLQLFGIPACPVCDHVIQHCRCPEKLEHDRQALIAHYPED